MTTFPDAETACRAFMSSGGTARAVQHSGEERVRQAILTTLEELRTDAGSYRFENHFRCVIAE